MRSTKIIFILCHFHRNQGTSGPVTKADSLLLEGKIDILNTCGELHRMYITQYHLSLQHLDRQIRAVYKHPIIFMYPQLGGACYFQAWLIDCKFIKVSMKWSNEWVWFSFLIHSGSCH